MNYQNLSWFTIVNYVTLSYETPIETFSIFMMIIGMKIYPFAYMIH